MGCCQTEQPLLGEEAIGPSLVIQTLSDTVPLRLLAEDAPQASSDPSVQSHEHVAIGAVLE
jgi:hypothetical protein